MKNYFNTIKLAPKELEKAEEKAIKQNESVLETCKRYGAFSPSFIWRIRNGVTNKTTYGELCKLEALNGVRRAINNLYNKGLIERVLDKQGNEVKHKTKYNSKEFVYQIV